MIAFGPVPSRRLGQSLGINNIPPKSCSYSCVYCQVGPTVKTGTVPRTFHAPEVLAAAVTERVQALRSQNEKIDFLTFVPDGEPTLDVHLGDAIELIRPLGVAVAVITNGSLLWRPEVRARLAKADWVSVKVDAVQEDPWARINRPDPSLNLAQILQGIRRFASAFEGFLATETMLVQGINDSPESVAETARFLADLSPSKAYLAVPTRPMAETDFHAPDVAAFKRAYSVFGTHFAAVACLTEEIGGDFGASGNAETDLLGITSVHPMTEDAVRVLLSKNGETWGLVEDLIARRLLKSVEHQGKTFFIRRF